MMFRLFVVVLGTVVLGPAALPAQQWNSETARAFVAQAIARRAANQASGLEDYRARAHGFVFFLAQLGDEGFAEPPQLVKSDQLELEVYWKAPGASKQRIIGWRDRVDLPTEIQYHRDHLGIVQNGFADRIRLGEGDEVRDVPHPLAPDGPILYDYAVVDSLTVELPGRTVRAVEVAFRPTDFAEARIVGSMYLDADGGQLVQLRFNFTRAAYLDGSLEDITVLLENALWEGRWWLPRRQEIEIRRRTTWLDLPARGIIRGRWMIDGYDFNLDLAPDVFRGREVVVAPPAIRDTFLWAGALDAKIAEAVGPVSAVEMDEVRSRVREVSGGRFLSGLPSVGLTFGAISDLLHFNRVEGFTPGGGVMLRPGAGAVTFRSWAAYGFSDERLEARASLAWRVEQGTITARAAREIRDVGEQLAVSPLANSVLAQETGTDYGDYVLAEEVALGASLGDVTVSLGALRTTSVAVGATPATGSFRANPALGDGTRAVGRVALVRRRLRGGDETGYRAAIALEGGVGDGEEYLRARLDGQLVMSAPGGSFHLTAWLGWATAGLPVYRPFLLGGRASLVGEPHRAFGGKYGALARAEWRIGVPFPAIPLGAFASTGRQLVVAPFLAAGGTGRPFVSMPWGSSDGIRPVVGVAVEVFHRLLRLETGWGVRSGDVGVTLDVRRTLWPIL